MKIRRRAEHLGEPRVNGEKVKPNQLKCALKFTENSHRFLDG